MYEKSQFDSLVWGSLPFAPIRLSGIHMTPWPHGSTFVPFPDLISRPRRKTGRNPGRYHSYITDYYVFWSIYDHASSITDTPTYPSSLAPSVPSLPVDPSRGNSPDRVWYTISIRTFWTTCTHTHTHTTSDNKLTNMRYSKEDTWKWKRTGRKQWRTYVGTNSGGILDLPNQPPIAFHLHREKLHAHISTYWNWTHLRCIANSD